MLIGSEEHSYTGGVVWLRIAGPTSGRPPPFLVSQILLAGNGATDKMEFQHTTVAMMAGLQDDEGQGAQSLILYIIP